VDKIKQELLILEEYLPQQLSEDELLEIVKVTISEVGATSKADMGKVMSAVMPKVKGQADGSAVKNAVASLLK
jgi:uncharacterized protein YqeY